MNLFAWLLARFLSRTPKPVSAPTPATAPAPPTEAEQLVRAWQRQTQLEQVLAQRAASGHAFTQRLPVPLQRVLLAQDFNQADQLEARVNGWWQYELHLQVAAQYLQAARDYLSWQQTLLVEHGEVVGRKLGAHQIEVGMTLQQLFDSYGEPASSDISCAPHDPHYWYIRYGSSARGSRFELKDGVVVKVYLGTPTLPRYVLDKGRELGR